MHFLTLVPVTVPAQEPDPIKDVLVQATLMELRKKSESDPKDFMAKIFASELTGKVTPFGRAVFDAVYEKMDPYAVETDHPACREFVDCTDEIREEYRTGTTDCVRLADGTVVERFDPRFRNRFSVKDGRIVQNDFGPLHHKKRSKKAKKMTWLPNYPKKKLYRSERELAETYYGYDYLPEEDAYGYYSNTAAFYDWHAIGGRWPHLFLVPEDCTEYTFGDYEGTEEETKGPEGYRWVAAARKKDIAWDVMAKLAQQRQTGAYSLLKTAYETRELPEKSFLSFTENGIQGILKTLYLDGESLETFLNRNGCCADSKYQFTPGGYLAEGGYEDSGFSFRCPKNVQEAEQEAKSTRDWALELDAFIDALDDDAVLVGVDCHI